MLLKSSEEHKKCRIKKIKIEENMKKKEEEEERGRKKKNKKIKKTKREK
jgi:hypothetical protein